MSPPRAWLPLSPSRAPPSPGWGPAGALHSEADVARPQPRRHASVKPLARSELNASSTTTGWPNLGRPKREDPRLARSTTGLGRTGRGKGGRSRCCEDFRGAGLGLDPEGAGGGHGGRRDRAWPLRAAHSIVPCDRIARGARQRRVGCDFGADSAWSAPHAGVNPAEDSDGRDIGAAMSGGAGRPGRPRGHRVVTTRLVLAARGPAAPPSDTREDAASPWRGGGESEPRDAQVPGAARRAGRERGDRPARFPHGGREALSGEARPRHTRLLREPALLFACLFFPKKFRIFKNFIYFLLELYRTENREIRYPRTRAMS